VGVRTPRLAKSFTAASPDTRKALFVSGLPHIDPCFFAWALMAIFILTVSFKVLQYGLVPRPLGYLGLAGGILYFLVFLGALLRRTLLVDLSVGVGGLLLGPVWYIWMGFVLIRVA